GCYPVSVSRYLFDEEPTHVMATMEYHPETHIDLHVSGVLEFNRGRTIFFSSIQQMEHQEVSIFATRGKIHVNIPFNPPPEQPAQRFLETETHREIMRSEVSNQYTAQADTLAKAIKDQTDLPVSLLDAVQNMEVIDAIHKSAHVQKRIKRERFRLTSGFG